MHRALTSASFGAWSIPSQSTRTSAAADEVAERLQDAGAVDGVLARTGDEIGRERLERDAALPIGRRRRELLGDPEAGDAHKGNEVAAVAGLGELRDPSRAADAVELRQQGAAVGLGVRLDHPDDPVALQGGIHHGEIARLEDVQGHLPPGRSRAPGKGKTGITAGQSSGPR